MHFVVVLSSFYLVAADIFMHNPRGSNNRLNENTRDTLNQNRVFDSQNNARGGYPEGAGNFYYYGSSILPIEWTAQHSCDSAKSNCELILQYMCSNNLRDGTQTTTIPKNRVQCLRGDCDTDTRFGLQESYETYTNCRVRQRNKGLYTADQNMNNRNRAVHTRQDNQGTQHGYECPEERDYYPYWHPSEWKDIVIMTNDPDRCEMYQRESQNVKSKGMCWVPLNVLNSMVDSNVELPNNQQDCEAFQHDNVNGEWREVSAHNIPPPDCIDSEFSRDNNLGSVSGGYAQTYNWTIPDGIDEDNCAIRLRYNVSTKDFDTWNTFASDGSKLNFGSKFEFSSSSEADSRGYVFEGNAEVKPFANSDVDLRLNINTDQYGRIFEDRSFKFSIKPRPANAGSGTIMNLNVRGKRGNIVQVYPSVEYDFVPNTVAMSTDDILHFQWTGSDRQPRNNDGEGKAGTDRSNVVLQNRAPYDTNPSRTGPAPEGSWGVSYPSSINQGDFIGLSRESRNQLASLGRSNDPDLNDASPYFDLGLHTVSSSGTYHYMSTRNNNFSNRSQKGKIVVSPFAQVLRAVGSMGAIVEIPQSLGTMTVKPGSVKGLRRVHIELWPGREGETLLSERIPNIQIPGEDYASPLVTVTVDGPVSEKASVLLSIVNATDTVNVFEMATGARSFSVVGGVKRVADTVEFEASVPGIFVARTGEYSSANAVKSSLLLAVLVLLVNTLC